MNQFRIMIFVTLITIALMPANPLTAQERTNPNNQSEELGRVSWYRNYDDAISAAKTQQKDIVLLFQEVPGCSTCRNYGHNVLSHPLMVEALENSFIPLAIYNNKGGEDKKILQKFNEPSWNNPVVRIIDVEGNNLVNRVSGDYSALTLCKRMKETLQRREKSIPLYLDLLEQELSAMNSNHVEEAVFKMYCFWSGEKELGKVDGVLDVESGFMNHGEVVKVQYNPMVVGREQLIKYGNSKGFEVTKKSSSYRTATNDVHYYLLNSDYKYLPLTKLQKTKINSALGSNQSGQKYLSPQQVKWLHSIKNDRNNQLSLIGLEIEEAWKTMEGRT